MQPWKVRFHNEWHISPSMDTCRPTDLGLKLSDSPQRQPGAVLKCWLSHSKELHDDDAGDARQTFHQGSFLLRRGTYVPKHKSDTSGMYQKTPKWPSLLGSGSTCPESRPSGQAQAFQLRSNSYLFFFPKEKVCVHMLSSGNSQMSYCL